MRAAYARPDASEAELDRIADAWRPFRSWVSMLFRSAAGGPPGLLAPA
jgi:3-methyladenine DNA glycosylase/8-oxoguanine DNA glycosylase